MPEVLLSARRELTHAGAWYESRQEGLGARFLVCAADTLERIGAAPEAGSPAPRVRRELGVRRMRVRSFPYHAVYVTEPRLVVVAFAHDARRPTYWRRRLRGV